MNQKKILGRRSYVDMLAKEYGADGIIYEQIKFCDPWAYERMVGTHVMHDDYGYPVLSIDRPYSTSGTGQLRTRIQAFIESIEIKKDPRRGQMKNPGNESERRTSAASIPTVG